MLHACMLAEHAEEPQPSGPDACVHTSTFYCHAQLYLAHTLHPLDWTNCAMGCENCMQPILTLENMLEASVVTLLEG